jgi:predicted transcriptional regulator
VTNDVETPSSLAQLTAEIVSAYVSNNKIALSDVATLISAVGSQMAKIGTEVEPTTEEKPEPAVPFGAPFSRTTSFAWSAVSRRRCSSATWPSNMA